MYTSAVDAILLLEQMILCIFAIFKATGKKLGERARRMKTVLRNDIAGHLTVLLPPGRH